MKNETGVSNHQGLRRISNHIDRMMGWEGDKKGRSLIRGVAHGFVHVLFGLYKLAHGNKIGFKA